MTRDDLDDVVFNAVTASGGSATLSEVARWIWANHEVGLRASGDLFYSWQYDMRWSAQRLRDSGKFKDTKTAAKGRWEVK